MKEFAKLKLTDVPATQSDLCVMVCCVSKLPELSKELAGSVWQLTAPQQGYIVGHFYYVYYTSTYEEKLSYIDLTEDTAITENASYPIAYAEQVVDDERLQRALYWKYTNYDDTDPWVCDMVVCKDGDYPSNINDGRVVLVTTKQNQYTTRKTNWYVTSFVSREHTESTVKYRVFHVFRSGRKLYDNMY